MKWRGWYPVRCVIVWDGSLENEEDHENVRGFPDTDAMYDMLERYDFAIKSWIRFA